MNTQDSQTPNPDEPRLSASWDTFQRLGSGTASEQDQAFEQFFALFSALVIKFVSRSLYFQVNKNLVARRLLLKDMNYHRENAEQEVWIVIIAKLYYFKCDDPATFEIAMTKYISVIAKYVCRQYVRKLCTGPLVLDPLDELDEEILHELMLGDGEQHDAENALQHQEDISGLKAAIRQLPQADQNLIILRYVEELPYKEIATITGKTPQSLRVARNRIIKRLRDILNRSRPDQESQ